MTNSNNDIEELEELLTELEGQEARIVTSYSEEDDAVTQMMTAPLGDQEWMVQVTALDRRMMSTSQLLSELQGGKVTGRTLVWRGGMDDWMPIARVDELSRASAAPPAPSRMGYPAPAPQASQPMWSNPANALPPPPMVLAPPPPPPQSSGYGLPRPVPVAMPLPAPPPASMTTSTSSSNTTRPVAVDFSDMEPANDSPLQGKRWVMALSAVAILAVFVTVYSLSSGGGESESSRETAAAARPQAVNALQPSSSASSKEKPAASSAAAAPSQKDEAEPATAAKSRPSDDDRDSDEGSSSGASSAKQTAPARYSPRSDYRRRMKASSDEASRAEEEEEQKPTAAAVAPAPAAPRSSAREEEEEAPSEPVAAVAEEVDEPPKSTGKGGSTFNRDAAKAALDEAASQAKNCRPQGGPSGTGRVQVRYEPSGKVSNVAILTSKFDNTTAGSCVRMLFRRAKVPEFSGAPVVVVNKSFEIP